MSKIVSIATNVPNYKHAQKDLFLFADKAYKNNEVESRKLRFLYNHSGIDFRYSVLPDFDLSQSDIFLFTNSISLEASVEQRMECYNKYATEISVNTIEDCIKGKINSNQITHLITVSCTGMSAPGLDLQIVEAMGLPNDIMRSSVNFMGCYAAIHALKLADAFCMQSKNAQVVVVCTEFCTLHFQNDINIDSITSSLLFADGCAAVLVNNNHSFSGFNLENFYSKILLNGKNDMSWNISKNGFLMKLSGYVPELIKADFENLVSESLNKTKRTISDVTQWCIHPGGKKILDTIKTKMNLDENALSHSYDVLKNYGNMSSPTVLFVLKSIMDKMETSKSNNEVIFTAAFGPGLTMETFTATYD